MPHAGSFLPLLKFLVDSMVTSCNNDMHAEESLGTRLEKSPHMLYIASHVYEQYRNLQTVNLVYSVIRDVRRGVDM